MEALGDGPVGEAIRAPAAGALLFGLRDPGQDDQGQEQQRCPPSEKAGHLDVNSVVIDRTRARPCRFQNDSRIRCNALRGILLG